jgi:hypothetical protein
MAEGDPAIHAASTLCLEFAWRKMLVELLPIIQPFQRRTIWRQLALKFHETGWFSHSLLTSPSAVKLQRAQLLCAFKVAYKPLRMLNFEL